MVTILIAEDDKNIQLLISTRLKSYYNILCVNNGEEAIEILETRHIDLLITDIMMPVIDGFKLVQYMRKEEIFIPILMLTAKQSFDDKRIGFASGVDDYMTKPINYEELHWRVEALLRRAKISSDRKIEVGKVILDSSTYSVSKGNYVVELPKKEFELLYKLLSYPGRIFTKNQLLDEIWGYSTESGEETIKTHISRIRNKVKDIEEFSIITIKGIGYKAEIMGEG